jgi:hypothetical protein
MEQKTERSGSPFVAANTDDGKPLTRLELFHDTVAGLKSITVGFEVPGGTTLEQTRALVDTCCCHTEIINDRAETSPAHPRVGEGRVHRHFLHSNVSGTFDAGTSRR